MHEIELKTIRIPVERVKSIIGWTGKIPIFDMGDGVTLVSKFLLDENILPTDRSVIQAKSLMSLLDTRSGTDTVEMPEKGWDALMIDFKTRTDI